MLTPQEITGKEFVKAVFGGYDMSAVDEFLEKLTADYSALYKENAILKSKIKVLVEKVEEYRSTEDAMRMALLTAQKMGDELLSEANKKSADMVSKAEEEAKVRLASMKDRLADEEARLKAAEEETRKFVAASQEIMRQHGLFLSRIEEIKRPAPAPAPTPSPEVVREEKIVDTARQIDSAVTKLVEEDEPIREPAKPAKPVKPAPAPAPAKPEPVKQEPAKPEPAPAAEPEPVKPAFEDESEPTKLFRMKTDSVDWSDDDEPTSPRPKFDFENLRFGSGYSIKDD